ncbi:hypothetical protein NEOLEDRAFT_1136914 [Neolentinus lepideus HHB14362 ss-1]|uniref:J domain-containing protein n=1 Tax=Neolentinus lepideus HHB14362 ss-1 TaxID=1314782 RepID=A0A165R3M2_9AGAM|nr:hypothetical protein NEOLEDRAFT_1136914 [Neolentinus lepideus HHB14362 ss-1]
MVLLTKLAALVLLALPQIALADSGSGSALYPPGLLPLINRANTLFSAGQFNEASRVYSEAIEQSPLDYLLYYRRATAYLSLSRHPQALSDLDKVLELTNNSFDKAHLLKARIHALTGQWTEARSSLGQYTKGKKGLAGQDGEPEAMEVMMSVGEGEAAEKKARQARQAGLWTLCEEESSIALRTATHSVELRQLRVDCSLQAGDVEGAVGDLTRITHLASASTSLFMRIFRLTYFLLPATATDSALSTLKQCLHYDPDSKLCFAARRLVKTLSKSMSKLSQSESDMNWYGVIKLVAGQRSEGGLIREFEDAVKEHFSQEKLPGSLQPAKSSPRLAEMYRSACRAYTKLGKAREGEAYCDALLGMKGMEDDAVGLVGRGEALLVKEEWEAAVRVLERAFEATGKSDREVLASLQKAQKLLKQSKQKDYYKVLGVARDADQKTIKQAYRKATMKAHPDKGGSEAKMATVNEAYEVLSNPELRARFDAGDDPNDPMAQQGGHPFQQSGYPGGAQFMFSEGHPFADFFGGGQGGFQFQFGQTGGRSGRGGGKRGH